MQEEAAISLRFRHEKRGERAGHALLHRKLHDARAERLVVAARLAACHQRIDLRLRDGAAQQRARPGDRGKRRGVPIDMHRRWRVRGELGVHEALVARLHAIERRRPDPRRPRKRHLHARASGHRESRSDLHRRARALDHHPVLRERAERERPHRALRARVAERDDIEPLHAHRAERMRCAAEAREIRRASGGERVADDHETLGGVGAHIGGGPDEGAFEIGGAERTVRTQRRELGHAEVRDGAAMDDRHALVERGHGDGSLRAALRHLGEQ